ncbi:unnamed protein product [Rhodiola kirilowii]
MFCCNIESRTNQFMFYCSALAMPVVETEGAAILCGRITLPADFPLYPDTDPGSGLDVCEQVNVARIVSEATGRGIAKAEKMRRNWRHIWN